jgi:hypothetical protein
MASKEVCSEPDGAGYFKEQFTQGLGIPGCASSRCEAEPATEKKLKTRKQKAQSCELG